LTVTVCGDEAVIVNEVPGTTVTPEGKFETCIVTEPVNPLSGVTLTLKVVAVPEARARVSGETPIEKSGDGCVF
jgi:hypothetical protein